MKNLISLFLVFSLVTGIYLDLDAQSADLKKEVSEPVIGYKVGDRAMDFNLKNVDGNLVSLKSVKNAKGYIVVFTSNVCPFAVLYQDRLIELHNKMAAKGYPVIAINSNDPDLQEGDSFENMKKRAKEKAFPFHYLQDEGGNIFPHYGATKTPHVYLLDKDLIVQYIGAIDDNAHAPKEVKNKFVENAIASLEKGSLPDPNYTKAIGCPIKSKKTISNNKGHAPGNKRRGPPSPDKILEMMDKDKDQKVSKSEAHGPLKNDFDRLDKDEDGYLTKEELSNIKPRGKKRM